MTDYYSESATLIPCSNEEASKALTGLWDLIEHTEGGECTADVAIALKAHSDTELTDKQKIIFHTLRNHPDYAPGEPDPHKDITIDLKGDLVEEGIMVSGDTNIDIEHAAAFTYAVCKTFSLQCPVDISVAYTASKLALDAFGGNCCLVTNRGITWPSTNRELQLARTAFEKKERYFLCTITEINGGYEYQSTFLHRHCDGEDLDAALEEILLDFRGEGTKSDDGLVWYEDALAAKSTVGRKEIQPHEFAVMQNHLSVLA